jgi:trigger factor
MVLSKKSLPHSRVELEVSVNAHAYRHAIEHELELAAQRVTIPGFRAGKAPIEKVRQHIGQAKLEATAIEHAISETYYQVVTQEGIVPVENPQVSVKSFVAPADIDQDEKEVLRLLISVDILPEISIAGYETIKVKASQEAVVEQDELEKVLDYLRKQRATMTPVGVDEPLAIGMWADIGYVGSVDGLERDDMKNEHHPIVVGEGALIPGFEDAIVGMKVGEKHSITPSFPKDYHSKELAGKQAQFEVILHELKQVELPELGDAFAKQYGHETMQNLRSAISENLIQEKKQESRNTIENEVVEQLVKLGDFELPQSLVTQEIERMHNESKQRLSSMNFQWDTYLTQVGKTEETIKEDSRPQAEKNVRLGLLLGKIMDAEGVTEKQGGGRKVMEILVERAVLDTM